MATWIFEAGNREVRFLCRRFAQASAGVAKIVWRSGVKNGTIVKPGDSLADITFNDGTTEVLTAPAGCDGVIDATNRQINYLLLPDRPSQWALRLGDV